MKRPSRHSIERDQCLSAVAPRLRNLILVRLEELTLAAHKHRGNKLVQDVCLQRSELLLELGSTISAALAANLELLVQPTPLEGERGRA